MAEPWDRYAQMKKWKDGINLITCSNEEVLDYLDTRLFQYKVEKLTDDYLWELFKEDFSDFDLEALNCLD